MLRFWSWRLAAPLVLAASFAASAATAQQHPPVAPAANPVMVTPTNGLVTIESDLQKADNSTGVVTATGNVRIVYPDQRVVATARQAQYFSREGRVVLSGDVDVLQEGGHSIRAERLVYLVERERVVAEPALGEQVVSRYRLNAPTAPQP
ncbi:LPS-assembly protein LptD [Cyanobium sp. FACHB-13342]|uniref:LptA/OstA family protein n=1 Tax=Cyanobium sp. FACHB-13342 TaxID=2692793 RepID=UPI0016817A46|nr:LPS-assembly protein LptD [Cyanobium sp. FACHB-13342]MBD2423211.1 LPS-assembly protein LptD [Cyanobium sp. FACHB-13342]